MPRAIFGLVVLAVALLAPWPVTLALVAVGAARWGGYVEGAIVCALVEGAATPDRAGVAWLPLTSAALAIAGAAEIARRSLTRRGRATV